MGVFPFSQTIFTYSLDSNSFEILPEYSLMVVAFKLISGTGSYIGSRSIGGVASESVPLIIGEPVTISMENLNYLTGLTITADVASVIKIIAR